MSPHWLYLAAAIAAEVLATSALKAAQGFTQLWPSVIVIVGYGVAFYCLSHSLQVIPMGVAYAIWSGVGLVLIGIAGWVLYGQIPDLAACLGMLLIAAGVLVINLFSGAAPH